MLLTAPNPASAALNKVFFVTNSSTSADDGLFSADLDGSNVVSLASGVALADNPGRVAYDPVNDRVYLTNSFNGASKVIRYDVISSGTAVTNRQVIWSDTTTGMVGGGVALDVAAGYVFFTTNGGTGATTLDNLYRCGLDGSNVVLLGGSFAQSPADVALDTVSQKIYVMDKQGSNSAMIRCNYDGTNKTTLVSDTTSGISFNGIMVDPPNGNLYYTTGGVASSNDALKRSALDGTGATTLLAGANLANEATAMSLNRLTGEFYYCDQFGAAGGVYRANTPSATNRTLVYTNSITGRVVSGVAVATNSASTPTVTTPTSASITATGSTLGARYLSLSIAFAAS